MMYAPIEKTNLAPVVTEVKPEPVVKAPPNGKENLMCLSPEDMEAKIKTNFKVNTQMRSMVTYYLEVRNGQPYLEIPLYAAPSSQLFPIGELRSGDIIKVDDSSSDYLEKQKADRTGETIWRKATVQVDDNITKDLWFKYNWQTMNTLSVIDQPFELTVRIPRNAAAQPLYKGPGMWDPSDCRLDSSVCVTTVTSTSRVFLLDSQFMKTENPSRKSPEWWTLFYRMGVDTMGKNAERTQSIGWGPSHLAFRRIDQVPAYLYMAGNLIDEEFLPEDEKLKIQQKLFTIDKNRSNPEHRRRMMAGLGLDDRKMAGLTSIFDLTLQFDFDIGYSHQELNQPFAGPVYKQDSVIFGSRFSSALFADLELRGTMHASITAASNNSSLGMTPVIDVQQWLVYTTPWNLNDSLIKFGVGAFYISMISNQEVGGFRGFVGPQSKLLFSGDSMELGIRFAPIAQDFNFRPENRLLGASLAYKLPWKKQDHSYQLIGELSNVYYKSVTTGTETKFDSGAILLSVPLE